MDRGKCLVGCATFVMSLILSQSIDSAAQKRGSDRESETQSLISQLYQHPWAGPSVAAVSPVIWNFSFTEPMEKLLKIGPPAQNALLEKLPDPLIRDQVIILLGGIGDESVIDPIIDAMIGIDEQNTNSDANVARINLSANLAFTNITVADVVWGYGGGPLIERCSGKLCWQEWWQARKSSFTVKDIIQNRNYSNYPNYGIYKHQ